MKLLPFWSSHEKSEDTAGDKSASLTYKTTVKQVVPMNSVAAEKDGADSNGAQQDTAIEEGQTVIDLGQAMTQGSSEGDAESLGSPHGSPTKSGPRQRGRSKAEKRRSSIMVPEQVRVQKMKRQTIMGVTSDRDEEIEGTWQGWITTFLDHNATQAVLLLALLFALFAADSFAAGHASDSAQDALEYTLVVVLFIFLLEFVLNCLSRPDYIMSFFFFMDILGTLSIVADIPMIMAFFGFDFEQGTVMRASRAARVGSRAGRMTKLVRLLRVVRVVRLYKLMQNQRKKNDSDENKQSEYAASAISERLSESISKQVAALSMLCIMAAPLLAYENMNNVLLMYFPTLSAYEGQTYMPTLATSVDDMVSYTDSVYERPIAAFVDLTVSQSVVSACPPNSLTGRGEVSKAIVRMADYATDTPSIAVNATDCKDEGGSAGGECVLRCFYSFAGNDKFPERTKDRLTMGPICRSRTSVIGATKPSVVELGEKEAKKSTEDVYCTYLQMDVSAKNEESSLYNIGLILFAIIVLLTFSTLLNSTCTRMVLEPLERMFNLLQKNAKELFDALDANNETNEDDDDDDINDLTTMESILEKMTRLIKHVSAGAQGQHLVDEIMDSNVIDMDTKSYLQSATGGAARRSDVGEHLRTTKLGTDTGAPRPGSANATVFKARINDAIIETWDFDIFDVATTEELYAYIARMFSNMHLLDSELIPRSELHRFLEGVAELMGHNRADPPPPAYHNFLHVCDVTHSVYRMISLVDPILTFTTIERLGLMVAALGHDLGHPGINNAFLVNTRDSLATVYNDISVLENSHVSKMYEMMALDESRNIFKNLPDNKTWFDVRKLIIDMILHTDMSGHFSMVSKLEVFLEIHGDTPADLSGVADSLFLKPEDRLMMLGLILHAADVSNPMMSWEYCNKWTERVTKEFFDQGDRERAAGLPISPGFDREAVCIPQSQVNFYEFVIAPLVCVLVRIFPTLKPLGVRFGANRDKWQEQYFLEVDKMADKSPQEKVELRETMLSRQKTFWEKYSKYFKEDTAESTGAKSKWR